MSAHNDYGALYGYVFAGGSAANLQSFLMLSD